MGLLEIDVKDKVVETAEVTVKPEAEASVDVNPGAGRKVGHLRVIK